MPPSTLLCGIPVAVLSGPIAELPDLSALESVLAVLGTLLLSVLVKSGVLLWAYVRTRKLAALVYAVFLWLQGLSHFVLVRMIEVRLYSMLSAWLWLIEIGLFIWLIVSLARRSHRSSGLPSSAGSTLSD